MAESVAVIALGASVLTFIDVAGKVIARLKDVYNTGQGLPDAFQSLYDRLPLLLEKVEDIKGSCDNGLIDQRRARCLRAPIEGCKRQIEALNVILTKCFPPKENTSTLKKCPRWRLVFDVVRSISKEKEIQRLQRILQEYESTLTFYLTDIRTSPGKMDCSPEANVTPTRYFEVPGLAVQTFVGRKRLLQILSQNFESVNPEGSWPRIVVLIGIGGGFNAFYKKDCTDPTIQAKAKRSWHWSIVVLLDQLTQYSGSMARPQRALLEVLSNLLTRSLDRNSTRQKLLFLMYCDLLVS